MNQYSLIVSVLRRDGHITKKVADGYRVENLKARIHELRVRGWKIETIFARDALGKRYARYTLRTAPRAGLKAAA